MIRLDSPSHARRDGRGTCRAGDRPRTGCHHGPGRAHATDRGGQFRRAAHAEGDAGGGGRDQPCRRAAGAADQAGGGGRRDQSRGRGARRAQADRRGQGAGDHGHLGVRGDDRGRAGVLGEQDVPHHGIRRRQHHPSAAPGLSDPHPAEQRVAGDQARRVHHPPRRQAGVHHGDPGAVRRADAALSDRQADTERCGRGGIAGL